jgi:exopolysaccharide biosynthesis polyprenyl glycosylphosphotransferase
MKSDKTKALFSTLLVISDALMTMLAFVLAYYIRRDVPWPNPPRDLAPLRSYIGMLAIQVMSILIVFFIYRLYHQRRAASRVDEFYAVFGAVSIGAMMSVAITALTFKNNSVLELDFSRAMIIYAWLLTIALVTLGRLIHNWVLGRARAAGWGRDRLLIVGTGEVAQMILQKIQWSPWLAYEIVGIVAKNGSGHPPPEYILGVPVKGFTEDLPRLIDEHGINEVIIALPEVTHQETLNIIALCDRSTISVKVFPDVFQFIAGQVGIDDLGGLPLLSVRDVALRGWKLTVKRAIDVVGSMAGLVLLSPLMLLMAVLIKLESPGPVFYVQERMGLDARSFPMLKFRSMRQDAEQNGPGWTRPNDPRRTRLGALMRQLNIDELPQFINVLIGDMSLVGPRAERPVYVEQFRRSIPRYMDRHREKAGLTGWAQVNGLRGDTSIAERTKYDLWYIENWSLLLDLKILIRTVMQFFSDHNAY